MSRIITFSHFFLHNGHILLLVRKQISFLWSLLNDTLTNSHVKFPTAFPLLRLLLGALTTTQPLSISFRKSHVYLRIWLYFSVGKLYCGRKPADSQNPFSFSSLGTASKFLSKGFAALTRNCYYLASSVAKCSHTTFWSMSYEQKCHMRLLILRLLKWHSLS